jgi:hypothetical protein
MPSIDFKLSKKFESTRRAHFDAIPSWTLLAARIGYLYTVPEDQVGVSYTDADGDEITMSSYVLRRCSSLQFTERLQGDRTAGVLRTARRA